MKIDENRLVRLEQILKVSLAERMQVLIGALCGPHDGISAIAPCLQSSFQIDNPGVTERFQKCRRLCTSNTACAVNVNVPLHRNQPELLLEFGIIKIYSASFCQMTPCHLFLSPDIQDDARTLLHEIAEALGVKVFYHFILRSRIAGV